MAGLSKVWIGKESYPLADVEDLPDDETLEHYLTQPEIVTDGALNHDLIARAGITEIAEAARVDEHALVDAVMGQKAVRRSASVHGLGPDALARIAASIVIKQPDGDEARRLEAAFARGEAGISAEDVRAAQRGSIDIVKVPKSRQETAILRVDRLLTKGKRLRDLEKVIYAAKEGCLTHRQILKDLDNIASLVPPRSLTLAEIEAFSKDFYGFSARLDKKLAKDQRKAALFAKTAHNARARRDKSRSKRRIKEIERVAEFWGLPEIKQAKSVKRAHLIDKDLTMFAEDGVEPIDIVEIVSSPYLPKPNGSNQG